MEQTVEAPMSRTEACRLVRDTVKRAFPRARVSVNEEMNPATPIAVVVEWSSPSVRKVVRAPKLDIKPLEFAKSAVAQCEAYYRARAGGSALSQ